MSKAKVSFYTFGCRLNQSETAVIQRQFEALDYTVVPFKQSADLVVVNTCTVTENGDADTRRLVNKINRLNPKAEIALVGCQAQMQGESLAQMPSVKWVVGNAKKMELPQIIDSEKASEETHILVEEIPRDSFTIPIAGVDHEHTRANIKIQDGCDFYCLFCEIPYARGRARSREFTDVLKEAKHLLNAGHRELILTGVNIGTYCDGDKRFNDVALALLNLENLERLRISSIEPTTMDKGLIEIMKNNSKLCRHLHIPIQSANDYVLRKMNRRYDFAEFNDFFSEAYNEITGICLGTDVIVGYPGETDERFDETESRLRELPFAYFHVFSYSERTMAKSKKVFSEFNVDKAVIAKRSQILRELSMRKRHIFMEQFIGQEQQILVERKKQDYWSGLTDNYIRIRFHSDKELHNEFVRVMPEKIENDYMLARLL